MLSNFLKQKRNKMVETYNQIFSDRTLASIFTLKAFMKAYFSRDLINISSLMFTSYMIDHILDLYIILTLSSYSIISKLFNFKKVLSSELFCSTKFITIFLCIICDVQNNSADLAVINMFSVMLFFILILIKSAERLDIQIFINKKNNKEQYLQHYQPFVTKCSKDSIKYSEDCVFCFENMNTELVLLPCKHVFHNNCFTDYIYSCAERHISLSCAICRRELDPSYNHK